MITVERLEQVAKTQDSAWDFGMSLVAFGAKNVKVHVAADGWIVSWDSKKRESI